MYYRYRYYLITGKNEKYNALIMLITGGNFFSKHNTAVLVVLSRVNEIFFEIFSVITENLRNKTERYPV